MTNQPLSDTRVRDAKGRPLVAVTGLGIVTSLGQGQADNWAALTSGRSGIHAIRRFPTEGLRTRIAGTVDFLDTDPLVAPALSQRFAEAAADEAIAQSGIGRPGDFPAPCSSPSPVEIEWPQRQALAEASGQTGPITYADLQRAAASRRFDPWHDLFIFGTVADHIADRFGTRARRSPSPPPARPAPPRSSSASRRSGAARSRPPSASAPTAR